MNLIRRLTIKGLRSIKQASLEGTGSITAFVGKNSSGKSNVLRALNLFFNGEIENGKPVSFSRDHFEQSRRSRAKKVISISADFHLPSSFNIRKELSSLNQLGGEFTIERTWALDRFLAPRDSFSLLKDGQPVPNGSELARQFLALVSYRYIPNRSIPSKLLQEESQAIASSIFGRMKGDQHSAALLHALTEAAQRMLRPATRSMESSGSPITKPSIATAGTLGEMLTMSGFQGIGAHGLPVQDEDWGSGHQAFFLYLILCSLDTSYGRFFGWRQATVWGVEEPESALHRDLETRLAEQLRTWSLDDRYRLQVFLTTHSPVFTMSAETGFWVELNEGRSDFTRMSIPQLTHSAEARGVTGWVHPILYFPWNPVVLVEGPIDADVLSHAATIAGLGHLRFVSLPGLDSNQVSGGKDKIITYLRNSHGLVQNRATGAPLFVLLDWEVSNQDLQKACVEYGAGGQRRVMRMNADYADPRIGDDFHGVERFYPPEVFLAANEANELNLAVKPNRPFSIAKSQLNQAKGALRNRVRALDSAHALKPLIQCVLQVETALREDHPTQLSFKDV